MISKLDRFISGFSRDERLSIKRDIAANIVSAIQTLLMV